MIFTTSSQHLNALGLCFIPQIRCQCHRRPHYPRIILASSTKTLSSLVSNIGGHDPSRQPRSQRSRVHPRFLHAGDACNSNINTRIWLSRLGSVTYGLVLVRFQITQKRIIRHLAVLLSSIGVGNEQDIFEKQLCRKPVGNVAICL